VVLGADPVSFSIAFAAGFVSFVSPCVLPLVPAYLGFISGVGFEERATRRWAVVIPTLVFVAGFAATFTLMGAGAGLFGRNILLEERRTLELVGGVFIVLMGLVLLGKGVPMFLMRERRMHLTNRPATLVGAAIAGAVFAIGWTPCIGPTLGIALTLAFSAGSATLGASLLFVYSLGIGVPLLLTGLFFHQASTAMGFVKRNMQAVTTVGSLILITFGVLVATGQMTIITAQLARYAPAL
jgi:cytochrome c-type biogenesis protein